jgi:hypothetical protein
MSEETTVNTIDVPSIDEFTQDVVTTGGRVITSKSVVFGVGYHGYCTTQKDSLSGSGSPILQHASEEIERSTTVARQRF